MSARIVELIETTLEQRGKGTEDDQYRVITQYWTKEGKLLFEIDPLALMRRGEPVEVITSMDGPAYWVKHPDTDKPFTGPVRQ